MNLLRKLCELIEPKTTSILSLVRIIEFVIIFDQDLLRVLGASTSGWTPEVKTGSGVKAEDDEEASDILRTAQETK